MPRVEATDKQKFNVLEEGDYKFVIVKATDQIGEKPPHNPYIHTQLQEVNSKTNVFENLVFSPKSAWRITNFWRALGNNVKKGDAIEFEGSDIEGHEISAHISVGDYNGSPTNDVDYFIEPDEADMRKNSAPPPKTSKAVQPF